MNKKVKVTRKECRKHLEQYNLACELFKIIKHFFPDLIRLLKELPDPRNQSYITYPSALLLMTRILSSVFYINSMRKASEELNFDIIIENIWELCGENHATNKREELPYWETINRYLKKLEPDELQDIICKLVFKLLRSRAFEKARFRNKYWQMIIDGTQLCSSRNPLDEKSLYRIHNKGTENEYRENYYYVLEAKIVLHQNIMISIMTEFVENDGSEAEKQDCERKACWRLMKKLKKKFPQLPICLCADSLYACERFFQECKDKKWSYLLRFKEGSIPFVAEEYRNLKKLEKNYTEKYRRSKEDKRRKQKEKQKEDKKDMLWYDYVIGIDYNGFKINLAEYGERKDRKEHGEEKTIESVFWFITNLPVTQKNIETLIQRGRMRWLIENKGFNVQKNQGYYIEHLFSKDYQAMKNHYFLIQIGHMISQIMEAWEKIWKHINQSMEQKHRRILDSFKTTRLEEHKEELQTRFQVRFP